MIITNKTGNLKQNKQVIDCGMFHRIKNPMHQDTCT